MYNWREDEYRAALLILHIYPMCEVMSCQIPAKHHREGEWDDRSELVVSDNLWALVHHSDT